MLLVSIATTAQAAGDCQPVSEGVDTAVESLTRLMEPLMVIGLLFPELGVEGVLLGSVVAERARHGELEEHDRAWPPHPEPLPPPRQT